MQGTIEERVAEIVAHQLSVEREEVVPEASFAKDLGADSLEVVELVLALEDEFEINIPNEEAEKITTVQAAIEYIEYIKSKVVVAQDDFCCGRPIM